MIMSLGSNGDEYSVLKSKRARKLCQFAAPISRK